MHTHARTHAHTSIAHESRPFSKENATNFNSITNRTGVYVAWVTHTHT